MNGTNKADTRIQLYGVGEMKPNHHFAVHTATQVRDYGPVYNFWAFLSERLNKIMKSFNLNNWNGGRLEVSMMRAFSRDAFVKKLVSTSFSMLGVYADVLAGSRHRFRGARRTRR